MCPTHTALKNSAEENYEPSEITDDQFNQMLDDLIQKSLEREKRIDEILGREQEVRTGNPDV